jgi:hypothetical protein
VKLRSENGAIGGFEKCKIIKIKGRLLKWVMYV